MGGNCGEDGGELCGSIYICTSSRPKRMSGIYVNLDIYIYTKQCLDTSKFRQISDIILGPEGEIGEICIPDGQTILYLPIRARMGAI
jgi:hypothetical protein